MSVNRENGLIHYMSRIVQTPSFRSSASQSDLLIQRFREYTEAVSPEEVHELSLWNQYPGFASLMIEILRFSETQEK